jgi:hypothetical protein
LLLEDLDLPEPFFAKSAASAETRFILRGAFLPNSPEKQAETAFCDGN